MKNNQKSLRFLYYILLYTGIVFFSWVILSNDKIEPIWELFADSRDYQLQSKISLLSGQFFCPEPNQLFAPRPFTVPLIYKLAFSDPYIMVILQRIIYCLCIVAFVFSFLQYISKKILKLIFSYLLLYFFTWWNIVGWSNTILSESLSMSFFFLWVACMLYYYQKQSLLSLVLLMMVSVIFSFTRDSWPYIILLFSIINFLYFLLQKNKLLKQTIAFMLFSIFLFLFQNHTSEISQRHKLPVFNSIAGRVSKNETYLNWFKTQGMPMTERISADFKNIDVDSEPGRKVIYEKYNDSAYLPLFNWVVSDGKSVYQKFMLSHPSYLMMQDQSPEQLKRIFCSNLSGYTQKPEGFFMNPDKTFPCFNVTSTLILLVIIVFVLIRKKGIQFFFPLVLILLGAVNAVISYNADALEVERHLFITQIILELTNILMIALLVNAIVASGFLKCFKFQSSGHHKPVQ